MVKHGSQDPSKGSAYIGRVPPLDTDINSLVKLTIVATDTTGRFTTTQTDLSFTRVNRPPQILAGDNLVIFFDENLSAKSLPTFPIQAFDADGDSLNWEVSSYGYPNFGEVLLVDSNTSIEEVRYIPNGRVPSRDEFTILLSDGNSSTEVLINAFFDASEFFINFPDQVPDAFENKSFQIQFFVQDNSDQFGDYTGLLKESPSWLSLQQNDQRILH